MSAAAKNKNQCNNAAVPILNTKKQRANEVSLLGVEKWKASGGSEMFGVASALPAPAINL